MYKLPRFENQNWGNYMSTLLPILFPMLIHINCVLAPKQVIFKIKSWGGGGEGSRLTSTHQCLKQISLYSITVNRTVKYTQVIITAPKSLLLVLLKYRELLYVGLPTDFFQCRLFCYELLACPSVCHTFYKFSHFSPVFMDKLPLYHLL